MYRKIFQLYSKLRFPALIRIGRLWPANKNVSKNQLNILLLFMRAAKSLTYMLIAMPPEASNVCIIANISHAVYKHICIYILSLWRIPICDSSYNLIHRIISDLYRFTVQLVTSYDKNIHLFADTQTRVH